MASKLWRKNFLTLIALSRERLINEKMDEGIKSGKSIQLLLILSFNFDKSQLLLSSSSSTVTSVVEKMKEIHFH
jgi:hypothetical protein